jgi:hypothetical protein
MVFGRWCTCLSSFVLLAACGRPDSTQELPVSRELRESSLAAVENLRAIVNANACDAAPIGSATPARLEQWTDACQQIQEEAGEWNAFRALRWHRPNIHTIALDGTGEFATETRVVYTVWNLRAEQPQLLILNSSARGRRIAFPAQQPVYFDPPLIPKHAPLPPSPDGR